MWRYTPEQHQKNAEEGRVWWGKDGKNSTPRYKRYLSEVGGIVPRTIWPHQEAGHNQDAVRELAALFGASPFASPKPTKLLERIMHVAGSQMHMDFFAGSGTTAHAAINLSRSGEARHRFLLVEMGEYFDAVTLQRISKVMFAPEWKEGKPNPMPQFSNGLLTNHPEWVERSPRLVQVLKLESFEDSLDALELPQEKQAREQKLQQLWGDRYLLNYMLSDVTAGSSVLVATDRFAHPWSYELRAGQKVDLPETFNLLIGLKVAQWRELHHVDRRYLLVHGVQHGSEQSTLVVWRDIENLDPEAEREWLLTEIENLGWKWEQFDQIYVNADSVLPRAESLDQKFKDEMMSRDRAFVALTSGGVL
ncbi:DNA methyltransferase [Deinococcus cellulosilyticus]|uniref:DNA methyltransferase n=1 Tax=Deinococcus cellulosilyticus TaxID=401558 RepID=UPI001649AA31|nr:DNA methyltransferase [Deinococcus cellulosilyticus]